MFTTEPYGNTLTIVKVNGAQLLNTMKHGAMKTNSGGFAQYSRNVTGQIQAYNDTSSGEPKRAYKLVENSVRINGKEINPEGTYYIATNDYLAVGGDDYTMLNYSNPETHVTLDAQDGLLFDVLVEYMRYTNAENFTPSTTNYFGQKSIDYYAQDEVLNLMKSNHDIAPASDNPTA
ncbi:UNVERIFIED_CONTAM: 5'-nucleotidase C-terminal domain-containing protein [Campylobacter lari]